MNKNTESFLSYYSIKAFREDLVDVTINGLHDLNIFYVNSYEDIVASIEDEMVEKEFAWSLSNIIEIVIKQFLRYKDLVSEDDDLMCVESITNYSREGEEVSADSTLLFTNEVRGHLNPVLQSSLTLQFQDFNNDEVIKKIIGTITRNVESKLNLFIIEETQLNNITLYSLDYCEFLTFQTNLTKEEVSQKVFDFKHTKQSDSLEDFSEHMFNEEDVVWNEICNSNIDFDNPHDSTDVVYETHDGHLFNEVGLKEEITNALKENEVFQSISPKQMDIAVCIVEDAIQNNYEYHPSTYVAQLDDGFIEGLLTAINTVREEK